ncbi:MAG: DUF2208 family protein, partial [Desulfurococcaceae archaeon]
NKAIQAIIQIISIILFALVSAIAPSYSFLFFIIYFIILMFVFSRTMRGGFKRVDQVKSAPLFKESDVSAVITSDPMLIQEVKEQFKSMMLLMILPFLVIFIAPLYWQYVAHYIENYMYQVSNNEFVTRFTVFLLFYVFLIGILQAPRVLLMRKMRQKKQIYTPRKYSVHKEGLILDNRLLELTRDLCIKVDTKRKFVEIHGDKIPFIVRLYTLDAIKLANKLHEVGLNECKP